MNIELIRMFGVALEGNEVDPVTLNKEAMKRGYIVHPSCCTQDVLDFIYSENVDHNSTFYKDWSDVTDKSRFELFVDQCIHYFMSYGLEIDCVPNDVDRTNVPLYYSYKYIQPIHPVDLYDKCMDMLSSNVAMKTGTVYALSEFVAEYVKENSVDFDIDEVANKEAIGILCGMLGIAPNKPHDLMRYIMYHTTGSGVIIKSKDTINNINATRNPFDFTKLTEKQMKSLASVFYRYKDILLAFRHNYYVDNNCTWYPDVKRVTSIISHNKRIINKIRRMAVKYHKPMVTGFWEEVLGKIHTIDNVAKHLREDNPSNFKLIQLIQSINDRLLVCAGRGKNIYIIRNGKSWVQDNGMSVIDSKIFYWEDLKELFENELVRRLSEKKCVVKFPKDLVLTCPTSEKNFMGDIPFGSYYTMKNGGFFGVYWEDSWGTRDFDLSFINENGDKIGWNGSYNLDGVTYSGDRTTAPNGASEVIRFTENPQGGIININRYYGNANSKYVLFFGSGASKFEERNGYMVNPNLIKVQTKCESNNTGQQAVGIIRDSRAYIMNLGVAGGRVSRNNDDLNEALDRKLDTFVDLKNILLKAGFEDYDLVVNDNPECEVELDLSDLKRDTLIGLFS